MDFHFSKSRYCSALQCPKMLWLETRRPELFDDSVMNDTVLQAGTALGELARGLFGDFAPVPYGEPS
ncbi:MAG: hypothetical protein MJ061_05815, partial [Mailhella sp.]|nr:hypothetical protein [Mailhella sp.]